MSLELLELGAAALGPLTEEQRAFADRGRDDLLGSHDFEDVISLINGRAGAAASVGSRVLLIEADATRATLAITRKHERAGIRGAG